MPTHADENSSGHKMQIVRNTLYQQLWFWRFCSNSLVAHRFDRLFFFHETSAIRARLYTYFREKLDKQSYYFIQIRIVFCRNYTYIGIHHTIHPSSVMMVPQWCCEVFIENKHVFRIYTAWHHVVYLQSKYTQASIINVIMTAGSLLLLFDKYWDWLSRQKNSCLFFENILLPTYN